MTIKSTTKTTTAPVTRKKATAKRKSAPRRKATTTKAVSAKKVAEKPAKKDTQKYQAGQASTELKPGTVMAAIIDTIGNKKMTREEITAAVLKSGYKPPKSREFEKNAPGYIKGYISAAVSRRQLVAV